MKIEQNNLAVMVGAVMITALVVGIVFIIAQVRIYMNQRSLLRFGEYRERRNEKGYLNKEDYINGKCSVNKPKQFVWQQNRGRFETRYKSDLVNTVEISEYIVPRKGM